MHHHLSPLPLEQLLPPTTVPPLLAESSMLTRARFSSVKVDLRASGPTQLASLSLCSSLLFRLVSSSFFSACRPSVPPPFSVVKPRCLTPRPPSTLQVMRNNLFSSAYEQFMILPHTKKPLIPPSSPLALSPFSPRTSFVLWYD